MARVTVWYDGACPLCRREIAVIQRFDKRGAIDFVDVSGDAPRHCPISQADLLARFHVQENGTVLSGAAGFAAMWRAIPLLRPFGEIARLPILDRVFEGLYRQFLRVRPRLQRFFADREEIQ